MYAGEDFDPQANGEREPFAINFRYHLPEGETIASATASLTVAADTGVPDPAVATRIVSGPTVAADPDDNELEDVVVVAVLSGLVPGARYVLAYLATTTPSGFKVELHSHIQAQAAS